MAEMKAELRAVMMAAVMATSSVVWKESRKVLCWVDHLGCL